MKGGGFLLTFSVYLMVILVAESQLSIRTLPKYAPIN